LSAPAFEIVSAADCRQIFTSELPPITDRALPITAASWQRIYAGTLPSDPAPEQELTECGQPWWMDVHSTESTATSLLWVPPDLPIFTGHFPGQPILPGIMQVNWGVQLAALIWPESAADTAFAGTSQVKFKAPVLPNALVQLQLSLKLDPASNTAPQIKLTLSSASAELTTLRLRYRD